ncbi:hypothetical protein ACWDYH_06850 [Nocardia goodfellowii]
MSLDRTVAAALVLVCGAQIAALALARQAVLPVAAAALALLVVAVVAVARSSSAPESADVEREPADTLPRWRSRVALLLDYAEGTQAEWDRHIRPFLAREFQLALGHYGTNEAEATEAAGSAYFGPELWEWVRPHAISDAAEPGPGRAVFVAAVERLERL